MEQTLRFWKSVLFISFAALTFAGLHACSNSPQTEIAKTATATEQASEVRCERGLTRIELTGGVEDAFATSNAEPARIRPARLPNAYLEAISKADSGTVQLRDYDEGGMDKVLIDHFDIPRGIVSGAVIVRMRTTGGSDNDVIRLGNLNENDFIPGYVAAESYSHVLKTDAAQPGATDGGVVVTVPFEALARNERAGFKGNFIDFLNRTDRPDAVDFEVDDDTVIDTAILVICQKPPVKRGTTFAEYRSKFIAHDVSFLSCFLDRTQAPCNPFQGDQLCTAELPMACYKPSKNVPAGLAKAGLAQGYSPGGEIRPSAPVAASNFATRGDADKFCQSLFGAGWRTLEYHDGVGGAIVTKSKIAPKTRVWVDVSDQRYANCWDRDKGR